jgi:hypothetical protein
MFDNKDDVYINFFPIDGSGRPLGNINFKPYVEKAELTFAMEEVQLPYAGPSLPNDKIPIRLVHNLNLGFKVFSENRDEAISNYDKLHRLINAVKPKTTIDEFGRRRPRAENLLGYLKVFFQGLPNVAKVNEKDPYVIHVTSFSYTINKDLGYIHLPYNNIDNRKTFFAEKGMRMVPIGYDVSLVGKLNLDLDSTNQPSGQKETEGGEPAVPTISQIIGALGYDDTVVAGAKAWLERRGIDIESARYKEENIRKVLDKFRAIDKTYITSELTLNNNYNTAEQKAKDTVSKVINETETAIKNLLGIR